MVITLLVALSELATVELHASGYRVVRVRNELVQVAPKERADGSFQVGEQLHNPRTGVTCTMRYPLFFNSRKRTGRALAVLS